MRGEEWDAQASAWIQTRYMFWGMRLAASYIENGGGSDLRTYGYTGGADSEAFVRVELSNHDGDYELARDFQGILLALIDRGTGAVVERYRYTPWGEVSIEDASGTPQSASQYGNRRFFLGRLWDAEIGIYDLRARWYEPDRGAFAGPDPLGAVDSWNLYQYGFGAPGRWSDPFGLQSGSAGGTLLWETGAGTDSGLGNQGATADTRPTSCLTGEKFTPGTPDDPSYGRTRSAGGGGIGGIVAIAAGLTPGVSDVYDATILFAGYDPITCESVGFWGRAVAFGGLIVPFVGTGVVRGVDNVTGYRAVSRAEFDDIAATGGFRPDPAGNSMDAKWFSETPEGAEQFRDMIPDADHVVSAEIPRDVYDRAHQVSNIDNTGPGFAVAPEDLPQVKPIQD